jgi:hypothetical protein
MLMRDPVQILIMEIKTVCFEEASPEHTDRVISTVREFIQRNKTIEHVVVATTEGSTGLAVAKAFQDKKVVVVTHSYGFAAPGENELSNENRAAIEELGARVLTTTHAFAGVSRGIRKALNTYQTPELLAVAYRTFGQGTKVAAEIAMMAADSGLVPVDKDVICIAGTGRGADTAWVVQPTYTSSFPELRMRACLCKPLKF